MSYAPSGPVDWTYEEIVLVCSAVMANDWKALNNTSDERVIWLSQLLRRASPAHASRDERFRNPNGVKRKSNDIATARADYHGERTKGGRTTLLVVEAFDEDPEQMNAFASAVRASILDPSPIPALADIDDATFEEGSTFERRHLARERSSQARNAKIAQARNQFGSVYCEACKFDFEETYGVHGRDFIECHHRDPLSVAGMRKTALADLVLLCSNCHRMIHRNHPWLTVDQLRELLA